MLGIVTIVVMTITFSEILRGFEKPKKMPLKKRRRVIFICGNDS